MKHYREQENVGSSKYVVSFHNGEKHYPDGSAFYDVRIFSNKRHKERFVRGLRAEGYRP